MVPKPHINEGARQMSGAPAAKACASRVVPERDQLSTGQCPRRGEDA